MIGPEEFAAPGESIAVSVVHVTRIPTQQLNDACTLIALAVLLLVVVIAWPVDSRRR